MVGKGGLECEHAEHGLFLCCYLVLLVVFSIRTPISLLCSPCSWINRPLNARRRGSLDVALGHGPAGRSSRPRVPDDRGQRVLLGPPRLHTCSVLLPSPSLGIKAGTHEVPWVPVSPRRPSDSQAPGVMGQLRWQLTVHRCVRGSEATWMQKRFWTDHPLCSRRGPGSLALESRAARGAAHAGPFLVVL